MRRFGLALLASLSVLCWTFFLGSGSAGDARAEPKYRIVLGAVASDSAALPTSNAQGVRYCQYLPGTSQPATMPPEVINPPAPPPSPTPAAPGQTAVPAATTQRQVRVLNAIKDTVTRTYVYPDYNGNDWPAITARYLALVTGGLTDADFATAMKGMITELGDHHSQYQSPQEVADEQARQAAGEHFVGIGAFASPVAGTGSGTILAVYPNSPAADAGLRTHDLLLEADGLPFFDRDTGTARSRGPEGTSFQLKFQRPGEAARTITIQRRAISGFTPVDYCIVPNTRIAYIMLPTFNDTNVDDQVRAALKKLTADGSLTGLVLDNRMNGGGRSDVTLPILGFFTSGNLGKMVSRTSPTDVSTAAEDIGGSQRVPLVILTGPDTVSYGEIFSGVLQRSSRARTVGGRTDGNVELLAATNFEDGSRLWLATFAFAPVGLKAGAWEGVGIVPDVSVPTRWDLFTEATDPALAQAVAMLQK
jgi:C-terminal peptidase prc